MSIRNRNLILLSFVVSSVSFGQETSAPSVTEPTVVSHGEEEDVKATPAETRFVEQEIAKQKAELAKRESELEAQRAELRKKNEELTSTDAFKTRLRAIKSRIKNLRKAIKVTKNKIQVAKIESQKDGLKQIQVEVPKILGDLLIASSGPFAMGLGGGIITKANSAVGAAKAAKIARNGGKGGEVLLRRYLTSGVSPVNASMVTGGSLIAGGAIATEHKLIPSINSLKQSKIGDGVLVSLGQLDSLQVRNLQVELSDMEKDLEEQEKMFDLETE